MTGNFVFSDTIARNVAFHDDEPDMGRVAAAAEVAHAHEFLARLPLGYDTRAGETGRLLSGGQRQRIAIARADYGRPPVLLFDEATSALDVESEQAVQQSMERLLAGRTSFVIAHRLSTIRNADLIVVIETGVPKSAGPIGLTRCLNCFLDSTDPRLPIHRNEAAHNLGRPMATRTAP